MVTGKGLRPEDSETTTSLVSYPSESKSGRRLEVRIREYVIDAPHMTEHHRDLNNSGELPFPPLKLWSMTHISKWEEVRLEMPVDKTDSWRNYNQVLDNDNVNFINQGTSIAGEEKGGLSNPDDEADEENADETWTGRKRGTGISIASIDSIVNTSSHAALPKKKHQAS